MLVYHRVTQMGHQGHRIAALDPPQPLASPLLQTLDGRFMRLLGRGGLGMFGAWVMGSLWFSMFAM